LELSSQLFPWLPPSPHRVAPVLNSTHASVLFFLINSTILSHTHNLLTHYTPSYLYISCHLFLPLKGKLPKDRNLCLAHSPMFLQCRKQ
jgi:hypothetical protein